MKWLSICTMGLSELIFTWIFQGKEERPKLHNPTNIFFHTLAASSKIKISLGIHSGRFYLPWTCPPLLPLPGCWLGMLSLELARLVARGCIKHCPNLSLHAGQGCFVCLSCQCNLNQPFDFFPWDPPKERCPMATSVT